MASIDPWCLSSSDSESSSPVLKKRFTYSSALVPNHEQQQRRKENDTDCSFQIELGKSSESTPLRKFHTRQENGSEIAMIMKGEKYFIPTV